MKSIGATVARNEASQAEVDAIRKFANSLGRVMHTEDAKMVAGARKIGATVITRDKGVFNQLYYYG